MSHETTDHVNNMDTGFSMAIPAASFLLRALQELRLGDDTITVEDLHDFAENIRKDMGLMIGTEEKLKEIFSVDSQISFHHMQNHHEDADHLSEKILQARQKLDRVKQDLPF